MSRNGTKYTTDSILEVVVSTLETEGYDAVQLRTVAKIAQVSLRTIYKEFPSREELIVAAIARWMQDNVYRAPPHVPVNEPLSERVVAILHHLIEPWKRSPRMLEAFVRVRLGPHNTRLNEQGIEEVAQLMRAQFGDAPPDQVSDVMMVLDNVLYALLARSVAGQLAFDELLLTSRRAVLRLTAAFE